jgi:hypothetical protein
MINNEKIVAFDMDETLGYFVEFAMFWEMLKKYAKTKNMDVEKIFTQEYFNKTLDIFSEFIRPNVLNILKFVKMKKMSKKCHSVMIYTNNQGPKEWSYLITNYFHYKLNYKLFDRVICAFKVNGKQIEFCRTTHDKTIKDFKRCSKLPDNVEICYLDDSYYPYMNSENVYYIKIKPYTHDLAFKQMIHRYMNNQISNMLLEKHDETSQFMDFMEENMNRYEFANIEKNKHDRDIDSIVTKKILMHLQIFFKKGKEYSNKKSVKNRIKRNNLKTRKIR